MTVPAGTGHSSRDLSGFLTAAGVSLARALAQRRVRGLLARNPGLPETALEDSVDPLVDLANSLH